MKFTCARIFSDNMVLQRNQQIPVHGTGMPGAAVTVTFNGASVETTVGADGKWLAMLPAMDQRGALTLTAGCEGESITFKNVELGEVWLAGGQSNMEFEMYKAKGGFADIANSTDPDLRYYQVPMIANLDEPDVLKRPCPDGWVSASPETTAEFSAVAFYFAQKLRAFLGDVPVGIVGNSWGGTSASCWTSEERLRADPDFDVFFKNYEEQCAGRTQEEYLHNRAVYDAQVEEYEKKLAHIREVFTDEDEWRAEYKKLEYPWPPAWGDHCYMRPCGLYQTMIKEPSPYGVRGAIWYQGEGDGMKPTAHLYAKLLKAVMEQWKEDYLNPDLFVGVVQLPKHSADDADDGWGIARVQQERMATEANGVFCVTYDVGEADDIHPIVKKPVGHRLADQVLVKLYGADIDAAYAEVSAVTKADGMITLTFTQPLVSNEDAKGFQILKNGEWSYVKADAACDSVTLCADQADAIRYAYTMWTEANVYQANGIPLKPFEVKIG